MTVDFQIPDAEIEEWLSELKPYQRNIIKQLLNEVEPEEAAKKWTTASGSINIVTFGGIRDTEPFWDRFKSEFQKFICDDEAYLEEKKALRAESPVTRAVLISGISAAIGASIGYTAALLAPAVTLLLFAVGKMGINAYCNNDR